jgi:hypothetical protein
MIPRPAIEWQEPCLFKIVKGASDAESVRPSIRIFVFVGSVAGCLLAWYFAKENSPDKHASFPVMLTLGVCVGGFITFVVPMLRAMYPYRVGFYERDVSRANKTNMRHWKYEDIAAWAVTLHQHQNQTLKVLNLHLKDGKVVAAGIADGIQTEVIAALFTKHGVKCVSAASN